MAGEIVISGASDAQNEAAGLTEGVLGTGFSLGAEVAFVAMALIAVYVAYGTFRYFVPETNIGAAILTVLGLREA